MRNSFQAAAPAAIPGLELWYRERRTLVDFRRGILGPVFDGFAAALKRKGYSQHYGTSILGICCQFNAFLEERGVTRWTEVQDSLIEPFLGRYLAGFRTTSDRYSPRTYPTGCLRVLFRYLIDSRIIAAPKPVLKVVPYSWLLDPFVRHLEQDCELAPATVKRLADHVGGLLDTMKRDAERSRFPTLSAEAAETFITAFVKSSPANPGMLTSSLRRFFRYCILHRLTRTDFSGLVPAVRRYRYAALPKGANDSELERLLRAIKRDTPMGARDYAIMLLMMAYGVRGISVAELLLDDIDWQQARIRIRAKKGGKEVVLPLIKPVGDAIVEWLRHRHRQTPFREVFLGTRGPHEPMTSLTISKIVHDYMTLAGIAAPGRGARTLRHSWAIRALANDSSIKAIADVLGHRYIDTTFIYAKADLKALNEVAMPWPGPKP
ncbi:MAG TPA: site-specific integrase [Candidatus Didemnitutus sp.]|nr:site-specific integrase [Candidatus Didemnitutus sp.]